jgi:hypothetical protein
MVNWHDPALLAEDYRTSCGLCVGLYHPHSHRLGIVTFVKLSNTIAGVYMFVYAFNHREACALISRYNDASWEVVITAGFELDVLRGKRPYRWTIWVSASYIAKPHCLQRK